METFDEYFAKRGFTQQLLEQCGGRVQDDSVFYNVFSFSEQPQGFVERRLNTEPRYVNGLTSSDTLYPIHVTHPEITKANEAIIVEGPSDALSILAHGVKNVVSFQGASNFGKRKLRILRRFCDQAWFILDRDQAGLQFMKHIKYKLDLDFPVYVCFTPVGYKDPAEYLAKGNSLSELPRFRLTEMK